MKTCNIIKSLAVVAVMSAFVGCILMFSACGANVAANTSLSVDADGAGIHAVAKNGADGSESGSITIAVGSSLSIEPVVNKGSFHVKVTDGSGKVYFDEDITKSEMKTVDASGALAVEINAIGADGTIDFVPYSIDCC